MTVRKTTVLDAVRMNRADPDAIIAAGELVEMRFRHGNALSLRAGKLFCLLIQEAGIDVAEDRQHRVPYSVLNETFHKSREELVDAVEELHSTTVAVRLTDARGRKFTKSGPILSDVEREDEELSGAEIRFSFSPTLRRVIANSTHWAAISRRAVLAFEGKYALRFYLFLSLRAGLRKMSEEIELEDLRAILGIPPDRLARWPDFRRYALDPALSEINHLAGFQAGYTPRKRGRRTVSITLTWGLKDPYALAEAHKELDRPRTGRTERRKGTVEAITQERQRIADDLASAPFLETFDRT